MPLPCASRRLRSNFRPGFAQAGENPGQEEDSRDKVYRGYQNKNQRNGRGPQDKRQTGSNEKKGSSGHQANACHQRVENFLPPSLDGLEEFWRTTAG